MRRYTNCTDARATGRQIGTPLSVCTGVPIPLASRCRSAASGGMDACGLYQYRSLYRYSGITLDGAANVHGLC